jgi:hypothetical protein
VQTSAHALLQLLEWSCALHSYTLGVLNSAAYSCETVEQQTSAFNAQWQLLDSQVPNQLELWTLQNRIGGA